jgi:hypothetical protein
MEFSLVYAYNRSCRPVGLRDVLVLYFLDNRLTDGDEDVSSA